MDRGLQSMRLQRVGHDLAAKTASAVGTHGWKTWCRRADSFPAKPYRWKTPPEAFFPFSSSLLVNWLRLIKLCCYSCLFTKLCPALHDPMDYSPPGSSVQGISQAEILEWVAVSFSMIKLKD